MPLELGESDMSPATASRRRFLGTGAVLTVGAAVAASPKSFGADIAEYDAFYAGFVLNNKIEDDSLIRIQKSGVLQVGIAVDPPYAYVDQTTGNYSGIDAEIVKFIMKMLKIPKYEIQTTSFDGLIPGLLAKRYDIIGDSMHYTPTRAQVVDFSFPTYYYSEWLMVKIGSPVQHATSIETLSGPIGSQLGNDYSEWLKTVPAVTYKGYKTPEDMINDLRAGRLNGIIHDLPILAELAKDHPEYGLVLGDKYTSRKFKNPVAYSRHISRQEDVQFREGWSRGIQWMQANGEIAKILDKYGLAGYSN
jgi:polar amino acid transport system substrate-binding protein